MVHLAVRRHQHRRAPLHSRWAAWTTRVQCLGNNGTTVNKHTVVFLFPCNVSFRFFCQLKNSSVQSFTNVHQDSTISWPRLRFGRTPDLPSDRRVLDRAQVRDPPEVSHRSFLVRGQRGTGRAMWATLPARTDGSRQVLQVRGVSEVSQRSRGCLVRQHVFAGVLVDVYKKPRRVHTRST